MSETFLFLHARAAGREILLPMADLREVVAASPVAPLPGGPPGIQGVVLHQGEFLPVLDWAAVPGAGRPEPPKVMAVLRPRLGLPLEELDGTLESPGGAWSDPDGDSWEPILAGLCHLGGRDLPVLDPDRLIALLHRLRNAR